jgi:hypothetical protein
MKGLDFRVALTFAVITIASIKQAASQVAEDLLSFYVGDQPGMTPGILPGPPPDGDYYWWIGGAMCRQLFSSHRSVAPR